MKLSKENVPLLLAFGVPLLFICIVGAIALIPSLVVKPSHDIIFVRNEQGFGFMDAFEVKNNMLTGVMSPDQAKQELDALGVSSSGNTEQYRRLEQIAHAIFYRYTSKTGAFEPVSFEDLIGLKLSASTMSPDGYSVGQGNRIDGMIFPLMMFSSQSGGSFTITKGIFSKKISNLMENGRSYYGGNMQFIGWVISS